MINNVLFFLLPLVLSFAVLFTNTHAALKVLAASVIISFVYFVLDTVRENV